MTDRIDIREVDVETVRPLRTRVLRPNYEEGRLLEYDGDDHEDAHHFAAVTTDEESVGGVVSYIPEPIPVDGESAGVRLRGMAVSELLRRRGIGSHLLSTTLPRVALYHPGLSRVWAAARTSVTEFYARHGFEPVGDRFEIPDAGPHRRMIRDLPRVMA